jgi:hypothetical protein
VETHAGKGVGGGYTCPLIEDSWMSVTPVMALLSAKIVDMAGYNDQPVILDVTDDTVARG